MSQRGPPQRRTRAYDELAQDISPDLLVARARERFVVHDVTSLHALERKRKLEAAAAAAAVPRAGEWAVSLKQRPSTAAEAAPPAPLARAATLKREGARAYPERARVAGTLAATRARSG